MYFTPWEHASKYPFLHNITPEITWESKDLHLQQSLPCFTTLVESPRSYREVDITQCYADVMQFAVKTKLPNYCPEYCTIELLLGTIPTCKQIDPLTWIQGFEWLHPGSRLTRLHSTCHLSCVCYIFICEKETG